MMKGNEDNIYRFDEVEMLANKVCKVFTNAEKQANMKETATKRHNPDINSRQLYSVYQSIINA